MELEGRPVEGAREDALDGVVALADDLLPGALGEAPRDEGQEANQQRCEPLRLETSTPLKVNAEVPQPRTGTGRRT